MKYYIHNVKEPKDILIIDDQNRIAGIYSLETKEKYMYPILDKFDAPWTRLYREMTKEEVFIELL